MTYPKEQIEGLRSVHSTMSCTDFINTDIEEKEAELEPISSMIHSFEMMNATAITFNGIFFRLA